MSVTNLKKEDFYSILKNGYLDDEEIRRTIKVIEKFNTRNGEKLAQLHSKIDVFLLTVMFETSIKVSNREYDIAPF